MRGGGGEGRGGGRVSDDRDEFSHERERSSSCSAGEISTSELITARLTRANCLQSNRARNRICAVFDNRYLERFVLPRLNKIDL